MGIAEDLPQRGVVAADQQEEALHYFAALVLAVAMDRRLQAAQHVAADHLRVAAIARVAAAGKLFAEGLHQFQRGLRRQFGIGLGRTLQCRKQRRHQIIVAEHHRRPATVFAQFRLGAQNGVADAPVNRPRCWRMIVFHSGFIRDMRSRISRPPAAVRRFSKAISAPSWTSGFGQSRRESALAPQPRCPCSSANQR